MNATDNLSLFDAMDYTADMLRATNRDYYPADDQLVFRRLQKQRVPDLTREEFQTLFAEWQERYAARTKIELERAKANLMAIAEEHAKHAPPAPPFKCVCGAETKDPLDPGFMAVHQPHFQAASEESGRRRGEKRSS